MVQSSSNNQLQLLNAYVEKVNLPKVTHSSTKRSFTTREPYISSFELVLPCFKKTKYKHCLNYLKNKMYDWNYFLSRHCLKHLTYQQPTFSAIKKTIQK